MSLLGEPLVAAEETAWRDVLSLLGLGFVCVVIMLLPHLHPPGETAQEAVESSGALMAELEWPCCERRLDVDLWIEAPLEVPVGYSNKTGPTFALLRDDLGKAGDPSEENREVAFGRGIPDGRYTINAHLYRGEGPVEVRLELRAVDENVSREILSTSATLQREGQELTLIRFEMSGGRLVPGSLHHLQRNLRSRG